MTPLAVSPHTGPLSMVTSVPGVHADVVVWAAARVRETIATLRHAKATVMLAAATTDFAPRNRKNNKAPAGFMLTPRTIAVPAA